MDLWVLFLLAGCILGFGEIISTGFYLAPFALAAFIAAAVDLVADSPVASILTFVVATILLFMFVRPIARRATQIPELTNTGTDALIGQRGIVLERVANDEGIGLVKIGGEVWTARTPSHEQVIAEGTPVVILEIRGATALVSEF
jgi:membrane protein implicated in regulation of membrane protease activity